MRFDLVDLQLFVAVADSRSITGGALQVHLALASASARIKGLEQAFGVALLKRGRRGVGRIAIDDHQRLYLAGAHVGDEIVEGARAGGASYWLEKFQGAAL